MFYFLDFISTKLCTTIVRPSMESARRSRTVRIFCWYSAFNDRFFRLHRKLIYETLNWKTHNIKYEFKYCKIIEVSFTFLHLAHDILAPGMLLRILARLIHCITSSLVNSSLNDELLSILCSLTYCKSTFFWAFVIFMFYISLLNFDLRCDLFDELKLTALLCTALEEVTRNWCRGNCVKEKIRTSFLWVLNKFSKRICHWMHINYKVG